ncbi:MAG: type I restriction-modification system subunit M [Flavipsychrobacter sp.]|nr:type I restriction-modification system subunit M [Flavipsychrobacter sp.]
MAIKKSELYSKLWEGCDALRGGMDASQYKDYVLVLLFVKYVSDKYAGDPNALIEVPAGGSYKDIVAVKGKKEIGEKIDTVIGALAKANNLEGVIDVVSFNDDEKLGKGQEMVDRLSDLIAIFEDTALDFSKNRAEGDDILGDAYEYLMRHFATESGKSKGQFYTPAEVSRVMAKVIGIKHARAQSQTIYDPTCGSGSLLLKAVEETDHKVTIYGQEKDVTTAALARMNMILHNNPTAEITKGQSTLSNPLFLDNHGYLKTFDYVVANPPFSLKNWTQGFNPSEDVFDRFTGYGIPPEKNGDYSFLLHIIKSLKSTGKGAVILPHGVLFRGNAEAEIRRNIINKKYIKGIIGLPANLFYGTGIPACIIVIDKAGAEERKGIFMIDASKGYIKDGNKNRLREQDIHKITDVFDKQLEIEKYSRFVPYEEIADPKNDYNLNIPRYIDSQEEEDVQDIAAHMLGGIPVADVDALHHYWTQYPNMRKTLFTPIGERPAYCTLNVAKEDIKPAIFNHPEFTAFGKEMATVFESWRNKTAAMLKQLQTGFKPKQLIHTIAEDILTTYTGYTLIDAYDVYQHLLNYWNDTMQDDAYLLAADGWKATPYRIIVKNKKTGKETDKGWACDLVPASLIINRYYAADQQAIDKLLADAEAAKARMEELEEEHSADEGWFADYDKVNKATVAKRLKEIAKDKTAKEERTMLEEYLQQAEQQSQCNKAAKEQADALDKKVLATYQTLTEADIKQLVVDDKWMAAIQQTISAEMERISQRLTQRIKELAERYETPLPTAAGEVAALEEKVYAHLQKMGYTWN